MTYRSNIYNAEEESFLKQLAEAEREIKDRGKNTYKTLLGIY